MWNAAFQTSVGDLADRASVGLYRANVLCAREFLADVMCGSTDTVLDLPNSQRNEDFP